MIAGLGGNDRLSGLEGNDLICGGKGADTIRGGAGKDRLRGETGDDRLYGGTGRDDYSAGPGWDIVGTRDRRLLTERVDCGRGFDRVAPDRRDRLVGCEKRLPRGRRSLRAPE